MNRFILILVAGFLISSTVRSQNVWQRYLNIPVKAFGLTLKMPWAGGLNTPVLSEIDLNGDGIKDLFSFDRDGWRISTYINNGTPNTTDYIYAPQYISKFPKGLHDWALLRDYDCDGYEDLFTYSSVGANSGIAVYHNDFIANGSLSFSLVDSIIYTRYTSGFKAPLYVPATDIPAFSDIDNDGDLDILCVQITGGQVEYHKNFAIENTGVCSIDSVVQITTCWGKFQLDPFNNSARLHACQIAPDGDDQLAEDDPKLPELSRHAGSCLIAPDWNGNGLKEFVHGDILGNSLLWVDNQGTTDTADMAAQDSLFPSYSGPVNLFTFPDAQYFDVDNDSIKDLTVAPCTPNNSENVNNVWFYKNTGRNDSAYFILLKQNLFTEDMIDLGAGAYPFLIDVNGDGLTDILIGSSIYFTAVAFPTGFIYYYKNTGTLTSPQFELQTSDFASLGNYYLTEIHPAFGDLDGDGDKDMLVGIDDGTIIYFENVGGNFQFTAPNYMNIDVGNNAAPFIADMNKDGLPDLIVGKKKGTVSYFENQGTVNVPNFVLITDTLGGVDVSKGNITGYSTPIVMDSSGVLSMLVGCEMGTIFNYTTINNNLSGSFTLTDTAYGNIFEPIRSALSVGDINNDGVKELLVGNFAGGVTFYEQVSTNGISEPLQSDFSFITYPNPINENLYIRIISSKINGYTIRIFDSLGKIISEKFSKDNYVILSSSKWSNGFYICEIENLQKQKVREKVLVKH